MVLKGRVKTEFIRRCRRCNKLFKTKGKFSRVCDDCNTQLGRKK